MRTSAPLHAARRRVGQAGGDPGAGARDGLGLEAPSSGGPVLHHQAGDPAVVDRLQDPLGVVLHDHLLAPRPDVQAGVVPERGADVEEVVVGVDEEVRPRERCTS